MHGGIASKVADFDGWVAQHVFTGGIMPSHGLIRHFDDVFQGEDQRVWSGAHDRRTALDWLANYAVPIETISRQVYSPDWALGRRRCRLFFPATAPACSARGTARNGPSAIIG